MSAASLRTRGSMMGSAGLIAVALVATACGGSSSGASASSATTSAATSTTTSATSTTTSAAATTGGGTSAATSAGPTTSAGSSGAGATSSGAPTSAARTTVKATGGGKFCKDVAAAVNDAAKGPSGTTPAALKVQVQKTLAEFAALVSEAPSAIKPDLAIVAAEVNKVYGAIAKANYDVTKVDPALIEASESPQLKAASDHLDAYAKTTCGINTGS